MLTSTHIKKPPERRFGGQRPLKPEGDIQTEDPPCGLSRSSIHFAQRGSTPRFTGNPALLDHLQTIEFEPEVLDAPDDGFVSLKKTTAHTLLDAQINTADWLKELGAEDDESIEQTAQASAAREAFTALTTGAPDPKTAVAKINTPPAVRKLVTMLSAYDWQFVEEAGKIRGKAVAQLVEEMEHPDARIRLKAIELLGKVTEIGLFTERVSIKKEELADHELDERIREKLAQLQKTIEVEAEEKEERNADAEDVVVKEEDDSEPA